MPARARCRPLRRNSGVAVRHTPLRAWSGIRSRGGARPRPAGPPFALTRAARAALIGTAGGIKEAWVPDRRPELLEAGNAGNAGGMAANG